MRFFRKKAKRLFKKAKKGKIFEKMGKNVQNLKIVLQKSR